MNGCGCVPITLYLPKQMADGLALWWYFVNPWPIQRHFSSFYNMKKDTFTISKQLTLFMEKLCIRFKKKERKFVQHSNM